MGFCTNILVYAYILMECFKNHGFFSEGFKEHVFLVRDLRIMVFEKEN